MGETRSDSLVLEVLWVLPHVLDYFEDWLYWPLLKLFPVAFVVLFPFKTSDSNDGVGRSKSYSVEAFFVLLEIVKGLF